MTKRFQEPGTRIGRMPNVSGRECFEEIGGYPAVKNWRHRSDRASCRRKRRGWQNQEVLTERVLPAPSEWAGEARITPESIGDC